MQKLIVIVGPTASGKTGLAVELARQVGGEVISADSRQVYRDLDIGTEKATVREMRGVRHWCIDIASPKRAVSVSTWRKHAERALRDIVRRGKVPIVAGGTGLYIDALVYGTEFPAVKPNEALRRELEALDAEDLFARLQTLDAERAKGIEAKNPRRLIRAIEIATVLGKVPPPDKRVARYDVQWIGLNPGLAVLEERLASRLDKTIRKGLVAETKRLRQELGLSWKRINELGLEYRTCASYLRGTLTKPQMRQHMLLELRRYAQRQMRWFKRNHAIHWYTDPSTAFTHFPKKVPGTFSRKKRTITY